MRWKILGISPNTLELNSLDPTKEFWCTNTMTPNTFSKTNKCWTIIYRTLSSLLDLSLNQILTQQMSILQNIANCCFSQTRDLISPMHLASWLGLCLTHNYKTWMRWNTVILQYIKKTIDFNIFFKTKAKLSLSGFTDVDYLGCIKTFKAFERRLCLRPSWWDSFLI